MNVRDYCLGWAEARRRRERERRIWELIGGTGVLALLAAAIVLVLAAALNRNTTGESDVGQGTSRSLYPVVAATSTGGQVAGCSVTRTRPRAPDSPLTTSRWPPAEPPLPGMASLLRAIRQVESGDRATPPDGDGGRAIGRYQIHLAYWQDARVPGRYQDCRQEAYARRVVLAYWRRRGREALASGDLEVLARIHNGGPRGAASPATAFYWRRIRADLGAQAAENGSD